MKINEANAVKNQHLVDFQSIGLRPVGFRSFRNTAAISSSRIGVGFETLDRYMFDPAQTYSHLAELGAKWARVQTGWSRCEKSKGKYDFGWLDDIVDQLRAAGLDIFFSVTFGNKLYMEATPHESTVGCVPLYFGNEAREAWVCYVRSLAEHFGERVKYWEVWNEPNIEPFWYPKPPSGKDYVELVTITAPPIRQAVPDARISGAGTCGLNPKFLEEALEAGLADWIDICAFHPYQAVPEDNLQNMHDAMQRLFHQYSNGRGIEIWQGENGCPSQKDGHEVFPIYDMDETVQAKWVARRILADLKVGFGRSFYFHIVDLVDVPYRQSDGSEGKPLFMGLLRGKHYSRKPAFEVFQRMASLFDEQSQRTELFFNFFHVDPDMPQQSGLLASPIGATFVRKNSPMLAYWLSEDPQQKRPPGEVEIAFWWDSSLKLETPVLLDVLTGQYYDVSGLGRPFKGGLRFRLPLADYPLVLTDASVMSAP